jgi:hypothetical protein
MVGRTVPIGRGSKICTPYAAPVAAVPRGRLNAVTCFAKRLPVACVPEQGGVPPVGLDVIDLVGRRQPALPVALGTQRLRTQESFSCLAPPVAVAPRRSRTTTVVLVPLDLLLVGFTVAGHTNQRRAPWIPTGSWSSMWHVDSRESK